MKISTKARYAVMAMLELALHENKGPVNLTDISRAQGISLSYLEQLFANLRKKGLVKGRRGPGGGYRLGTSPHNISVADIVSAINEDAANTQIPRHADTGDTYEPAQLWDNLSGHMSGLLRNISLADCINGEFQDIDANQDRTPGSTN